MGSPRRWKANLNLMCVGLILIEEGLELRKTITRSKMFCYPVSSPTIQSVLRHTTGYIMLKSIVRSWGKKACIPDVWLIKRVTIDKTQNQQTLVGQGPSHRSIEEFSFIHLLYRNNGWIWVWRWNNFYLVHLNQHHDLVMNQVCGQGDILLAELIWLCSQWKFESSEFIPQIHKCQ